MLSINRQWLLVMGCLLALVACQHQQHHPEKTLETSEQAWADHRARSDHWHSVDRDFLQAELLAEGLNEPALPPRTNRFGFNTNQPEAWYGTDEGRRIANIILSFQTPSGGWSKRTDMGQRPRRTGEHFGTEPNYVPTFDNDATTTQTVFLALAYNATEDQRYLEAYLRGVNLILEAQYPNGGWPQSFPLRGGYHDLITFNDEAIENNLFLLYWLAKGRTPFESAPPGLRTQALASVEKALNLVVSTQVVVNGTPTLWGGQHDPHTLEPRQARAYEMVALATSESASLVNFLMHLDNPSPEVQASVHAAMAWYDANQINGYAWDTRTRDVVPDENAPPLWSRFAEIGTNRPLFGDRDGSVSYDINDISQERREGYGWYATTPNFVMEKYADWKKQYPARD